MIPPTLDVEGFVLAGGRSTRMGRDKAVIRLQGLTLVEAALRKLRALPLGSVPRIAGRRPDLRELAPVVEDLRPGCGPLSGMEAALTASSAPYNIFLPVDVPLAPARLLAWMLERARVTGAQATFPRVHGRPEPLFAVYRPEALQRIGEALDRGAYAVAEVFASRLSTPAKSIDIFDLEMLASVQPEIHDFSPLPLARWFMNCNAPEDLAAIVPWSAEVL